MDQTIHDRVAEGSIADEAVFEQNLSTRRVAIVALSTASWPRIRTAVDRVVAAVANAAVAHYTEMQVP